MPDRLTRSATTAPVAVSYTVTTVPPTSGSSLAVVTSSDPSGLRVSKRVASGSRNAITGPGVAVSLPGDGSDAVAVAGATPVGLAVGVVVAPALSSPVTTRVATSVKITATAVAPAVRASWRPRRGLRAPGDRCGASSAGLVGTPCLSSVARGSSGSRESVCAVCAACASTVDTESLGGVAHLVRKVGADARARQPADAQRRGRGFGELDRELPGRRGSTRRVLLQGPHHEVGQSSRHVGEWWRRHVEVVAHQRRGGQLRIEHRSAGEAFVEQHAERVEVGRGSYPGAVELLRRHVAGCAGRCAQARHRTLDDLRDAEVADLRGVVRGEQDVVGLDVPVQHVVLVGAGQRGGHGQADGTARVKRRMRL